MLSVGCLIVEFRAAFELFDKDHSGAISKEELGTVMRNLGMNPTDEELHEQIQMHDADGRCRLSFHYLTSTSFPATGNLIGVTILKVMRSCMLDILAAIVAAILGSDDRIAKPTSGMVLQPLLTHAKWHYTTL